MRIILVFIVMNRHVKKPLEFYSFESFDKYPELTNVSTTRAGGISRPPFDSLNLSMNAGDDPRAVIHNRTRLSLITDASPELLTLAGQVHGAKVAVIPGDGVGGGTTHASIASTDAMITRTPDLPLAILAADCAVVSLYDPGRRAVGIAHAGWKGTAAGVAARTVEKMTAEFGTVPADIVAGIGPSIGPCCYEVGEDVVKQFSNANPSLAQRLFNGETKARPEKPAKKRLDLWLANRLILEDAGVESGNIEPAGVCTSCNAGLYFSHRRDRGETGRFAGLIMIHGKTRRQY